MVMRLLGSLRYSSVFFLILGALSAQSLPDYLVSTFPASQQSSVPINAAIQIHALYGTGTDWTYSLVDAAGARVPLRPPQSNSDGRRNTYWSIRPAQPLQPSTRYTFSISRTAGIVDYSFDFTTGPGPDTTPPRIISVDPAPGTAGIGIDGPITVRFDKRLDYTEVWSLVRLTSPVGHPSIVMPSDDGTTVTVTLPGSNPFSFVELTIDASRCKDVQGNAGAGDVITARYTTFAASSGPQLQSTWPADGQTGVPTNPSLRLLFHNALYTSALPSTIARLEHDGAAVPVTLSFFAGGRGLAVQPNDLLAPNQRYRLTVTPSLTDSQRTPLAQEISFEFETGPEPDLRPAQMVETAPSFVPAAGEEFAANTTFTLRASRPFLPLATEFLQTLTGPTPVAVSTTLSADGQTLTAVPLEPLKTGYFYSLDVSSLTDTSGNSLAYGKISIAPAAAADSTPPTVLVISPADGAQEIPPAGVIQARFSEPIAATQDGRPLRITLEGGGPVDGTFTWDNPRRVVTFKPAGALAPTAQYYIEIGDLRDLAGNPIEPSSAAFTTAESTDSPAVTLVSSAPAANETGVDPAAPLVWTFSGPVNPVSAITGVSVTNSKSVSYPLTTTVEGGVVTSVPVNPLPAHTQLWVRFDGVDRAGRSLARTISFYTGSSQDSEAPVVTGTEPAAGSVLTRPWNEVTLQFSEPVDPATLIDENLWAYQDGARNTVTIIRRADNRSVTLRLNSSSGAAISAVATNGIRDLAGNPLRPFTAEFLTTPTLSFVDTPALRSTRIAGSGIFADPGTPISWLLEGPVNAGNVEQSLLVTANGQPVAGRFELAGDDRVVQFFPSQPFAAGASVTVFQRDPVFSSSGNTSFGIAAETPAAPLRLVNSMLTGPPGGVLDLEFSAEPPLRSGLVSLIGPNSQVLPAAESRPRPRTIRLTPSAPLTRGTYYYAAIDPAISGTGALRRAEFQVLDPVESGPAEVIAAGPLDGSRDASRNTGVHLRFGEVLNPLTLKGASIAVRVDGQAVPIGRWISSGGYGLSLVPAVPLPADTIVTVSVEGLEDRLGRVIAPFSSSFQTGSGFAWDPPTLLAANVVTGSSNLPSMPPDGSFRYVFDKPLNPASLEGKPSWDGTPLKMDLSADLKTVTLTPASPLPEGRAYALTLAPIADLSGNQGWPAGATITVGFAGERRNPHLVAAGPGDGETNLPLNTRIVAVFDTGMAPPAPGAIHLTADGKEVRLAPVITNSNYMSVTPQLPLAPNTAYELSIQGVASISGGTMEGEAHYRFTTGDWLDSTRPVQTVRVGASHPIATPLRIHFSEAMSRATAFLGGVRLESCPAALAPCYGDAALLAFTPVWSEDGRDLTVVPAQPLVAGQTYTMRVAGFADNAGNPVEGTGIDFTFMPIAQTDDTPPKVSVSPADGQGEVPVNARVTIVSSEAAMPDEGVPVIRLFDGDQEVVRSAYPTASGEFQPAFVLRPGATYRVEICGFTDNAGNRSEPFSTTFTTRGSDTLDVSGPKLVSTVPENGATGVAPDQPVVLTFDHAIDPNSVTRYTIQFSSSTYPVTGNYSVSGNTVTFTPNGRLPGAAQITIRLLSSSANYGVSVRDLAGYGIRFADQRTFYTAAPPDSGPPSLVSLSPEPGTTLAPVGTSFRFTFSEPVLVNSGLKLFNGSELYTGSSWIYYDTNPSIFMLSATPSPASAFSIYGTSAMTDESGNPVEPFVAQYPTGPADDDSAPSVASVTPNYNAVDVDPATPIRLQFNKPIDEESVRAAFHVTQNGVSIDGTVEFLDESRSLLFTPAAPYFPGARIDVFLVPTAHDAHGRTFGIIASYRFTVAGTAATSTLHLLQTDLTGPALELEFDRPLNAASVGAGGIWLSRSGAIVPARITLESERVIRIEPEQPLSSGERYTLTIGAAVQAADGSTQPGRDVVFAANLEPGGTLAGDPTTATAFGRPAIRLRFTAPTGAFTVRKRLNHREGRLYSTPDGKEWLFAPADPDQVDILRRQVTER